VPRQYGWGSTVYALFRRWQRDGTWKHLLTALQTLADAAGRITWDMPVDSTSARAHHHAPGARKRGIGRSISGSANRDGHGWRFSRSMHR
jgi:transposase